MMVEKKSLKKESVNELFEKVRAEKWRIIGPVKTENQVQFREIFTGSELDWTYIQTIESVKPVVFPKVEELFHYRIDPEAVKILENENPQIPTLVFGLRPCDAAGMDALNAVFSWDYQDSQFKKRLGSTTFIGVSCSQADDYCFCTSVGGNPGAVHGSDILLTRLSSGDFLAEIVTEKGKRLANLVDHLFGPEPAEDKEKNLAKIEKKFDAKELENKLKTLFDHGIWVQESLRCLGCGICAFVCPTCVCFDIQDEGQGSTGKRLRCWDSCGFSLFTLHTSGHNPRDVQSQRWRQRVMHKFSYQPERLHVIGCVGCGRCSRVCPVDMNLKEHLIQIMEVRS